ncbi:glutaminase [Microbacterium azadirachtae]|uniref:glutaminase n=1 Tax=Microbacterium azadirachtae TaxID=582680 RepID=UPI0021D4DAA8|nr:glutaminase [Microbacterium azadirachtae]UXW86619.1 glutaminase [Microbacterium azadirachtae]
MTAESTASLGSLLERARSALSDVPREALGREKTSRWRAPRIVRVGSAWHVGVLLIADDAVFATAEVLRAAAPVRRGYAAESARARAERRAEASRGGFRDGETVHVGWAPIDLDAVAAGGASGPLVLTDGVPSVRWSVGGGLMPLAAYLDERIALLHGER